MKVKTISFDLWGTLIKGNPEYKKARVEFLQQSTAKTAEEIQAVMTKIKFDVDKKVEKYGLQFNDNDLYKLLLNSLDITDNKLNVKEYVGFCHSTFVSNPPILCKEVINTLETLTAENYRILASSNTVFVTGKTMRIVLMKLGIFDYFYDFIFSDEVGYSKPHVEFFKSLHEKSHTFAEDILHTGDNSITDMNGARNYGMQHFFAPDGFELPETTSKLLLALNTTFKL